MTQNSIQLIFFFSVLHRENLAFLWNPFSQGINVLAAQRQDMGTVLLTPIADCELI